MHKHGKKSLQGIIQYQYPCTVQNVYPNVTVYSFSIGSLQCFGSAIFFTDLDPTKIQKADPDLGPSLKRLEYFPFFYLH